MSMLHIDVINITKMLIVSEHIEHVNIFNINYFNKSRQQKILNIRHRLFMNLIRINCMCVSIYIYFFFTNVCYSTCLKF